MKSLTITEAADLMGIPPQLLRMGLQQGRFPFGVAVKMKRWAYYINADRLFAYLEAKDMRREATP